tara:strand:- start:132 stop:821 length:690 start_codon:yes stop_codon:yes gene_type:complete
MNNKLRYEIKLVLNEREFTHVLLWLNMIGVKKKFADRIVNSLYFDNISQEAIQHNLAGISNRNKVRLRWYGENSLLNSKLQLEIKFRDGRLGSKIKYEISKKMINLKNDLVSKISNEIFKEIYSSNLKHSSINDYLVPMLLVKYERKYFENINGIRITIDNKIQFYDTSQNIKLNSLKPINYSPYIVEIKFSNDYKSHVSNLLRPTLLTPKRHSKYLAGLAVLGYTSYI